MIFLFVKLEKTRIRRQVLLVGAIQNLKKNKRILLLNQASFLTVFLCSLGCLSGCPCAMS